MPRKAPVLEKIKEESDDALEKKKVRRKKVVKADEGPTASNAAEIAPDNVAETSQDRRSEQKQEEEENIIDTNDINVLLNPPSHDLSKEKDIYIDMSKILKYTPLTIDGKSLDDAQSVLYAVPYGPHPSEYDILTYSELQAMINAQIVENNVKINRKHLRTPEGREIMGCSQDVIIRHKLHAWTLLSTRENA